MRAAAIPGVHGLFTVHDSFEADCENRNRHEQDLRDVYDSARTIIREDFGVDFDVPIRYTLDHDVHWPLEKD